MNTQVMTSTVQTMEAKLNAELSGGYFSRRNWRDYAFAALVVAFAVVMFTRYSVNMDGYDKGILFGAVPAIVLLGWFWRPIQALLIGVLLLTMMALGLYGGQIAQADKVFGLKYFLSSQSAILWMCVLFVMSTVFYWFGTFSRAVTPAGAWRNTPQLLGSRLAWTGVLMALVGTMVRWAEGYMIGSDIGHIPVSNLYEVFVLFCWLTTLFYLYQEARHKTAGLGAFVMLVVCAAVGFLVWYSVAREAHEIQPLIPALQSWWMKLHVPANFIGYGSFALSAMVAFAYLIKTHASESNWKKLAPLWLLGIALCFEPMVFRKSNISSYWAIYFGISALIVAAILLGRRRMAEKLPSIEVLDDVMYKSIALGFAFFTIATVLGALWAAEAWGGYWSWDPKETWALIVWLNYAAWLHMRLMKGLRGQVAAWWALTGLAITSFAFLGVNMFLSGLHSYGTL